MSSTHAVYLGATRGLFFLHPPHPNKHCMHTSCMQWDWARCNGMQPAAGAAFASAVHEKAVAGATDTTSSFQTQGLDEK